MGVVEIAKLGIVINHQFMYLFVMEIELNCAAPHRFLRDGVIDAVGDMVTAA